MSSTTATQVLQFTDLSHDSASDIMTLTFNSSPARAYSLFWFSNLRDGSEYIEIDDRIVAHPSGETTTIGIPIAELNPGGPSPDTVFLIPRQNG